MRRAVLAMGLACTLAVPVRAQTPEPKLSSVLSAVTLDVNDDGQMDRAVLAQAPDGDATLYLYLADPDPSANVPALKLATTKTSAAFAGPMAGQQPSLAVSPKGALLIRSTNTAVGRDKWDQTVTLVYRDKTFMVAGLHYQVVDTLDRRGGGSCDIDFLTGKGRRKGRPVNEVFKPVTLAAWSNDDLPKACRF